MSDMGLEITAADTMQSWVVFFVEFLKNKNMMLKQCRAVLDKVNDHFRKKYIKI